MNEIFFYESLLINTIQSLIGVFISIALMIDSATSVTNIGWNL